MNDYEGQLEELRLPLPLPQEREALTSSIELKDEEKPKRGVVIIDMFSWEEEV